MKIIRLLSLLVCCLQLAACAGFSNEYQCQASKGLPCKSIPEISELVDNDAVPTIKTGRPKTKSVPVELKPVSQDLSQTLTPYSYQDTIIRVPEETMSIFIGAYEDEQGVYHHNHTLQVVTADAYWKKQVGGAR